MDRVSVECGFEFRYVAKILCEEEEKPKEPVKIVAKNEVKSYDQRKKEETLKRLQPWGGHYFVYNTGCLFGL